MGVHAGGHAGLNRALLDVFSSLYEPYSTHDMVSVFHSEDFPNLLRNRNPSSGDDLSKEGNVLLIHLNWQSNRRANGNIPPVI